MAAVGQQEGVGLQGLHLELCTALTHLMWGHGGVSAVQSVG